MNHHETAIQPAGGAYAHDRRADWAIRAAAGVTVAALAGIAAAISYSHMRELAATHGQTGWQAHTFPLSVDGIEIVASLVLLADRRTGRSSGWLPWAALAAGTAASLAANVAAAGTDLVGRVIAGWPAFALLVAIKLLPQMLEPRQKTGRLPAVDDRPVPARPPLAGTAGDEQGTTTGPLPAPPETAANGHRTAVTLSSPERLDRTVTRGEDCGDARTGTARGDGPGTIRATRPAPGTETAPSVAGLQPAARAARDRLLERGEALTRDALAAELRQERHAVRNTKVSQLLAQLRQEAHAAAEAAAKPSDVGAAAP